MSKRKYAYYILSTEVNSDRNYDDYKEAFYDFNKSDSPATLYGVDGQGEVLVIKSKK